ncbi:FadR/GntR family transcriptional regulator [Sphingomonas sp. SUN039]|uniref:FadR/GntR family transcriptional regulator n=1 Tax=Sphingomonas sp. SUN039 TaxID=2937787 RepID=UPI0021649833|nr:FadR/GntR family transcriptional regulator [Sphingomonas sp. SUN039]UVO55736.1 FadR family transcriptional regulator [Sphingomonas sp. SUN039]
MARAERLHQAIARQLGSAILSGAYRPGDALDGEIEQALALGVSRTPYREAIRILVAKGLLESRPRAGTHVTARARWTLLDPDVLAWTFSGEPDEQFVKGLFELRGIIEPAAASLAAQRRTEAQIAAMQDSLASMAHHGLSSEDGRAADQQFHRSVLEATHNDALASLASSVGAAVRWTTRFKQQRVALPRDPLPEHIAVFDAIAANDGEGARHAMEELLRLALDDMAAALP